MSTRNDAPPACPADAEYTTELQARHRALLDQREDDDAKALTPAEVDELQDLGDLFARFRQWRGQVDRFYANEKRDRERPPSAADKDGGIGRALRAYAEGKGKLLKAFKGERRDGLANAQPHSTAGRGHGRGIARMAEGLRKGIGLTR